MSKVLSDFFYLYASYEIYCIVFMMCALTKVARSEQQEQPKGQTVCLYTIRSAITKILKCSHNIMHLS